MKIRTLILVVAAVALSACSSFSWPTVASESRPVGSLSFTEINHCLADTLGVEPLSGQPIIEYMHKADIEKQFGVGFDGVSVMNSMAPVERGRIVLRTNLFPNDHNRLFTHEVAHFMFEYVLGRWDASSAEKEAFAHSHDETWRKCVRA